MHAGIQDAKACPVEITTDACKEIGLVGCIHQHLQSFTGQGLPRAHYRPRCAHMA
ncbi:hypothetical protein D3C71_1941260 [compost metagenome]